LPARVEIAVGMPPLSTPAESGAGVQASGEPSGFERHVFRAEGGNLRRRKTGAAARLTRFRRNPGPGARHGRLWMRGAEDAGARLVPGHSLNSVNEGRHRQPPTGGEATSLGFRVSSFPKAPASENKVCCRLRPPGGGLRPNRPGANGVWFEECWSGRRQRLETER